MLCHDESVHGARLVVTDRLGGVSAPPYGSCNLAQHTGDDPDHVRRNRELLVAALGSSCQGIVFGQQVHGAGVRLVTAASPDAPLAGLPATDGLVTTAGGLALVMMGADCPPVLLASPGVVGVAHVGRPGLAAGVIPAVLRVMRQQGAAQITARIGPGICGGCYEVPAGLADEVEQQAPGSRSTTRQGTPSIDITAGVRRQLAEGGVRAVVSVGGCTFEQPDLFYSYRRDGRTGRHAGLVMRR